MELTFAAYWPLLHLGAHTDVGRVSLCVFESSFLGDLY